MFGPKMRKCTRKEVPPFVLTNPGFVSNESLQTVSKHIKKSWQTVSEQFNMSLSTVSEQFKNSLRTVSERLIKFQQRVFRCCLKSFEKLFSPMIIGPLSESVPAGNLIAPKRFTAVK